MASISSITPTSSSGKLVESKRSISSSSLSLSPNASHTDLKRIANDEPNPKLPPRTKIICTLGPASVDPKVLTEMLESGMNVARLNFSHGSHEYHGTTISRVKELTAKTRRVCAILLDTKGPEIRTGKLKGDKDIMLVKGQEYTLTTDEKVLADQTQCAVQYPNIGNVLRVGDTVLIDDGLISLTILEITSTPRNSNVSATASPNGTTHYFALKCRVNNSQALGGTKGVNLPGVVVDLPAVTAQDEADILFGAEQGVDFIAASFVRKGDDVLTIRRILDAAPYGKGKGIKIIAKIESQEGLDNFDGILAACDGIMVARGDLGVEIPLEQVALAQKAMIRACNAAGKPVITATQMLESMVKNPSPTRAEASDVANAVLDGTDCVMLSGETAKGAWPVAAVRVMADICREAESQIDYRASFNALLNAMPYPAPIVEAIASASVKASYDLNASLVLVLTESGTTARLVAKYRPRCPILTITPNEQTARQALISRATFPLLVSSMTGSDTLVHRIIIAACENLEMCRMGDLVIVTSGTNEATTGATNDMRVIKVAY